MFFLFFLLCDVKHDDEGTKKDWRDSRLIRGVRKAASKARMTSLVQETMHDRIIKQEKKIVKEAVM